MENKMLVIQDYYKNLQRGEKSAWLAKVAEGCGISYPTVLKRMRENNWNKLEIEWILKFIGYDKES